MKKTRRFIAILGLIGMAVLSDGVIVQHQTVNKQATIALPGPLSSSQTTNPI